MKTITLIALVCCMVAGAQQNNDLEVTDVESLRYYERVMIEAGMRIPMDKLGDKMGASPEAGFWFRSRMRNGDMFDIGFSAYVPAATTPFDYEDRGESYKVSPAGASGMAGFRMCKVYDLEGTRYRKSVEWISSFGYAWFMYRDRYAIDEGPRPGGNPEEVSTLKSFSTFHIGQGLRFNVDNVGFQVNYSYTPYGQFSSHVPKDFGSHALTVGVVYRQ